jgi:hypothetical protein
VCVLRVRHPIGNGTLNNCKLVETLNDSKHACAVGRQTSTRATVDECQRLFFLVQWWHETTLELHIGNHRRPQDPLLGRACMCTPYWLLVLLRNSHSLCGSLDYWNGPWKSLLRVGCDQRLAKRPHCSVDHALYGGGRYSG